MEAQQELKDSLTSWIATRMDEVVWNHREGYYPFKIIAEAFEQGAEIGREAAEKEVKQRVRNVYYEKSTLVNKALTEILSSIIGKGYSLNKLFVKHSIEESSIIISVSENTHDNADFINYSYNAISIIEQKYLDLGLNLDISFVDETVNLNLEVIKNDGFEFAYDLNTNSTIK